MCCGRMCNGDGAKEREPLYRRRRQSQGVLSASVPLFEAMPDKGTAWQGFHKGVTSTSAAQMWSSSQNGVVVERCGLGPGAWSHFGGSSFGDRSSRGLGGLSHVLVGLSMETRGGGGGWLSGKALA